MNAKRFAKGDLVAFDFTIDHPVAGKPGARRLGFGTIADDEINYACWPPGYSVRVTSSAHYKTGEILAVTSHNLSRV
jgi:hypothetical protein